MAGDQTGRVGFLALFLIALLPLVFSIRSLGSSSSTDSGRRYEEGDSILIFANVVRPFNNSCEAYPYFSFPFCPPGDPAPKKRKSLSDLLAGGCFTNTQYDLKLKVEAVKKCLCLKNLTSDDIEKFKYAIERNYEYDLYSDNIRFKGHVGVFWPTNNSGSRFYLHQHINFSPYYKENQVEDIDLFSDFDSALDITELSQVTVNFTYSVNWKEYKKYFSSRETLSGKDLVYRREKQRLDLKLSLIWISLLLAWVGLVFVVTVPYLKNYFSRYPHEYTELSVEAITDLEQIHTSVWSGPPYSSLLGAVLAVGTQHLIVIFAFVCVGRLHILDRCKNESFITYFLLIYSLASFPSGYQAVSFHEKFSSAGWKECIFQTGTLYLVPALLTLFQFNIIGRNTGVSDLPNIETTTYVLIVSVFATFSLLSIGGVIAHRLREESPRPLTSQIIRVRQKSWYRKTPFIVIFGGFINFLITLSVIDAFYASLWNKVVCGALDLLLLFLVFVSVTTWFTGVIFTRYQLSCKDYQWQWSSVLRGGSTAIYVFAYGVVFHSRSETEGNSSSRMLLMMGHDACTFYSLFLVLGTISYSSSWFYLRFLYHGMKKLYSFIPTMAF